MLVKELIEVLSKLKQDAPIFVGFECGLNHVSDISVGPVQLVRLIPAGPDREEPYDIWCAKEEEETRAVLTCEGVLINNDGNFEDTWTVVKQSVD